MALYGYKHKTKQAPWVTAGMSGDKKIIKSMLNIQKGKACLTLIKSKACLTGAQRQYGIEARAFVEASIARGETCPVVAAIEELRNGRKYGHQICARLNENHHQRGKLGKLNMDKRFWTAMSKQGHRWVHSNIDKARQYGWLPPKGEWNVSVPENAVVTRNEFNGIKSIEYETSAKNV